MIYQEHDYRMLAERPFLESALANLKIVFIIYKLIAENNFRKRERFDLFDESTLLNAVLSKK